MRTYFLPRNHSIASSLYMHVSSCWRCLRFPVFSPPSLVSPFLPSLLLPFGLVTAVNGADG